MFGFWAGEAWGYLGSKRFVYDITNFQCNEQSGTQCLDPFQDSLEFQNIKIDKIHSIVELGQIGKLQTSGNGNYADKVLSYI